MAANGNIWQLFGNILAADWPLMASEMATNGSKWQRIGSKLAANGSGTQLPKTLRKPIGEPTI
jgi:hypothetical protein